MRERERDRDERRGEREREREKRERERKREREKEREGERERDCNFVVARLLLLISQLLRRCPDDAILSDAAHQDDAEDEHEAAGNGEVALQDLEHGAAAKAAVIAVNRRVLREVR